MDGWSNCGKVVSPLHSVIIIIFKLTLKLMSTILLSSSSTTDIKKDSSQKLLNQLLECVQECQKRYGGKKELATEFDSCVAGLCLSLEAVFLHGLHNKRTPSQPTLKQVSEIVAQSLSFANESPSFWPFVKEHLIRHEQERFDRLRHIWTDTGKGRSWLRAALNEKSLERYFHTLLSNSGILNKHYEPWAILRDDEKNSMLPNMAAGLGSILFAVCIDKPEFNSSVPAATDSIKNIVEPIIEAPIPENKNKHKTKKKVARQFISFDDDDSSNLSMSIPSSSSSTSSETNSIGDNHSYKSKCKSLLKNIREENKIKMDEPSSSSDNKPKIERKLSIETSGVRDKFSSNVPETLTPVSQAEIGELTPVSVEINKHFESTENLGDILEVPTDISAVLTAVEIKNNEELLQKDQKIKELQLENDELKEHIKKYVNAIQVLRSDDERIQKTLEELQIEEYKGEGNVPEKKFVQVAEMYAELMDFNVMLQQSLIKKEALLEKLTKELEELRGPLASNMSVKITGTVNIWIPSAFLTGTGSSSHHVYQIFLRAGNDEWNIYRRYAQFHALHTDLKKLDPIVGTFDFPPKKSIGKKDSALVEDRRKRLQVYLRKVIVHWPELAHCNSRFLLEQHLVFFKDQREDLQKKKSMFSQRSDASSNNYSGL